MKKPKKAPTKASETKPFSLAPLVAACTTFLASLKRRQEHDPNAVWTTEVQRLRAQMYRAAFELMFVCDSRISALGAHPVLAQLMLPLFAMLREPLPLCYKLATADEIALDVEWARTAFPTFNLTPDLTANLLLSDPSKVDEGDVPWPFTAFRGVLPPDNSIYIVDQQRQLLRAQCFRILRMVTADYPADQIDNKNDGGSLEALYAAYNMGLYRQELTKVLDEHFARIASLPSSERVMIRIYAANNLSVFHNALWEGAGTFCGDWLELDIEQNPNPLFGAHIDMETADERALLLLRRVALNLALYLRSKREDTGAQVWTPDAKPSSAARRTWTLGGHVKVGREVHDAARAVAQGLPRGDVRVRHIVRGHFKHAGADKRSIYVAPYWRGPATGPTADRVYEVT